MSSVSTASGCFCAEVTHDGTSEAASWAGCGEQGWCDVTPGCETALESGPDYSGWDHCTPAIPDAVWTGPSSSSLTGAAEELLASPAGRALVLDTLCEPGLMLAAAGAVAAYSLHWLANRVVPSMSPSQAPQGELHDPLLEETPCKLDPTANTRAQKQARMPFQSPQPVQQCIEDTGSASNKSGIPVRRLSDLLTPRQTDSPDPESRLRFGSSNAKRELSASKRGVQSDEVFCPKNALPRTPARGLAGLAASPSSADQQLRFESKSDWLSHHDEGLQLTADYSGGSVPLPAGLDDSIVTEGAEKLADDQGSDAVSSPSSVDSDAPSSPGEEESEINESHESQSAVAAPAAVAAAANWESMAADAGIPLAELETFGKMNAKDLIKQIGSLSVKGAAAVAAFESTHKGRKTVQQAVAKKIMATTGEEE